MAEVKKRSPFRATRMWNQLLSSFKEGMELKRKRWRLKSYNNCFSGAEALEWLHTYLQHHPSFGAHVTREQAFMLLQKFLENNVFEHAVAVKDEKKFQDTNCLYTFAHDEEDTKENSASSVDVKNTDDKPKVVKREKDSNSLSNIFKNFARNSRTISTDEFPHTPQGKPSDNGEPPILNIERSRRSCTAESCMTPLALDLDNISMMSCAEKNCYADMSTILFGNAEEDDVFGLNIAESSFMRSNSVRVRSRPSSNEDLYLTDLFKAKKKTDSKANVKTKDSETKEPSKKRTILRKFQKGSPKLRDTSRRHTVTLGKRQSDSAPPVQNESPTKRFKKPIVKSDSNLINNQGAMTTLLPRKAVLMLGEKPSLINEVNSIAQLKTLDALPGYKRQGTILNDTVKTSKDHQNAHINPLLGRDFSQLNKPVTRQLLRKSRELSKNHPLVPMCSSEKLPISPELIQYKMKKGSSPILQKIKSKKYSPHPMRRRSLSQDNTVLRSKCQSVNNINRVGLNRTQGLNNSKFVSSQVGLYKAPSTWSINTIGLTDGHFNNRNKPEYANTAATTAEISSSDIENTWKSVVLLSLKKLLGLDKINDFLDTKRITGNTIMKNVDWQQSELVKDAPEWLLSAMNCLIDWPSSNTNTNDSILQDLPNYPGFEKDVYRAVKEHYQNTLQEPLMLCHLYPLLQECSEIMCVDVDSAIRLLQHINIMLPCWNRRQLQLLVNFMKSIAENEQLELSRDLPNKDLVIHSFYRLIARKSLETLSAGCQDTISIRVTAFLLEHYDEVFKPPSGLRVQVDHKLAVTLGAPSFVKPATRSVSRSESVRPSSADDARSRHLKRQPSYCVQISKEEYEKQAKDLSKKAINELLDTIQGDKYLTEKERKKRLQQIQKAYPDIYNEYFAATDDTLSICSTSTVGSYSGRTSSTNFKRAHKPSFLTEKML